MVVMDYVPLKERCYRGCGRRAVIHDGDLAYYCARCFLDMLHATGREL